MKICVFGLWHLGSVTAACLASVGHQVIGLDLKQEVIKSFHIGQPPISEPGLDSLLNEGIEKNHLLFTTNIAEALKDIDIVWVTFDTPVDDNDQADVEFVVGQIKGLYPYLENGTLVLISSQLPVGTTARLEKEYQGRYHKSVSFGYSPENLRLGKAIAVFLYPERIVVGLRADGDRQKVMSLLQPITQKIEWMSVEAAEMTKHAINAFLATSVVFINELAVLCEQLGADAKEVERGLKSDGRIGEHAYLSPGAAFAGGTLARDVTFLKQLGGIYQEPVKLFSAVLESNNAHKMWVSRKLLSLLGDLKGKRIAVWGLTYKPGTNTLRRSCSIEVCKWMISQGAIVRAYDPAITTLPNDLEAKMELCTTPNDALNAASALLIATNWQDFKKVSSETIISSMSVPLVLDPSRFLEDMLGKNDQIQYITIGKS